MDFLGEYELEQDYDFIISQRFLINLMEWDLQKKVLLRFKKMLKVGGVFLMLEGSTEGVEQLNNFRMIYNLKPINVKWHNLFFNDKDLVNFMNEAGFKLLEIKGLGTYFFLTRGLRLFFHDKLNWDHEFNAISAFNETKSMLGF